MTQLLEIPLTKIRESKAALRPVDRTKEEYIGLVDSIRKDGVLNPIVVRPMIDPETREELYGLIDGLHRFSASQDAGKSSIPAHVIDRNDAEVEEAQILANVHKIETKPVQYSDALKRLLLRNPFMTQAELSAKLSKTPSWLAARLSLTDLADSIKTLVDENKINLSNAYALAKLPEEEQANFLERAMTMSPQEFVPTAAARAKEIKDLKRQGRDTKPVGFVAVPHLRKLSELKEEMDRKAVAQVLTHELKVKDPVDAFALGVAWVLHLDPSSIEESKRKDEARKAQLEADKEVRKKERDDKKAEEARKEQMDLKTALGVK